MSVLAFTDGKSIKTLTSAKDHKRVFDGDRGLNTGGMGVIAPNPAYTKEYEERAMKEIFIPTVEAMKKEGRTFKGVLYFGLILTQDGPKVIEYNCRFGDPETQAVLPLLETDLLDIMEATAAGRLSEVNVKWSSDSSCCLILASGGYPKAYKKGLPISGLDEKGQLPDGSAEVFHAGTKLEDGKYFTNGGRVLGVTATAPTLAEAVKRAYAAAENISFEGLHKRMDIGARALKA